MRKEDAMNFLDRYLQAVKKHLPWQRQDDIISELRANLESQLEDKESELGRPLTEAEMEAWIKQLGSPLQMASRYLPQQYLIGPALFPTYWYVLRLVFVWATAIYALVNAVLLGLNGVTAEAVVRAIVRIPMVILTSAAWVTLVFAVLEFAARRYPLNCAPLMVKATGWEPDGLPGLDEPDADGKRPRSYAHAVAEFIFGLLFLAWLLLVPSHPYLLMGPGMYYYASLPFRLAPVWMNFYWAAVGINVIQLAWSAYSLMSGDWQGPRRLQHLATKALAFVPLGLLLGAHDHLLFVLKNPGADEARLAHTLYLANEGTHTALKIVLLICVVQCVWELVRVVREAARKRVAA
jgi:hypothetical protein